MENIRQLIASLMEDMRRLDDQSVSHNDLLFVQMRMMINGWLRLADVHFKADSVPVASVFGG